MNNYPMGVSSATFGAPFNDQEYEYTAKVLLTAEDAGRVNGTSKNSHLIKTMESGYFIETDCDYWYCEVSGSFNMKGPKRYEDSELENEARYRLHAFLSLLKIESFEEEIYNIKEI